MQSKLGRLHAAKDSLNLTAQELDRFTHYFVGGVVVNIQEDHFVRALITAEQLIIEDRDRIL